MDDLKRVEQEADIGLELCQNGNLKEGIKHLQYAAERNNVHAIVNLGHAYKLYGNYEEAFKWTNIGASLGDKTAISNLAIMYRNAQGTECDVKKSVELSKKLIELGQIDEGYNGICCAYFYAKDQYQQDFYEGFKYALEGSNIIMKDEPQKCKRCETVVQLALCYDFGKGTEVNKKEALKCYKYCMECGSGIGISLYNSACIMAYDKDEELHNINKAINYFQFACENDYTDGFYELGYLYQTGKLVKKDLEYAKYCYSMAIRLGNGEQHYDDAIANLREISNDLTDRVLSGKYCPIID